MCSATAKIYKCYIIPIFLLTEVSMCDILNSNRDFCLFKLRRTIFYWAVIEVVLFLYFLFQLLAIKDYRSFLSDSPYTLQKAIRKIQLSLFH